MTSHEIMQTKNATLQMQHGNTTKQNELEPKHTQKKHATLQHKTTTTHTYNVTHRAAPKTKIQTHNMCPRFKHKT